MTNLLRQTTNWTGIYPADEWTIAMFIRFDGSGENMSNLLKVLIFCPHFVDTNSSASLQIWRSQNSTAWCIKLRLKISVSILIVIKLSVSILLKTSVLNLLSWAIDRSRSLLSWRLNRILAHIIKSWYSISFYGPVITRIVTTFALNAFPRY